MKTRSQSAAAAGGDQGDDGLERHLKRLAEKWEESADAGAGKPKRSKVEGRPRIVSTPGTSVADLMKYPGRPSVVINDFAGALAALNNLERQERALREAHEALVVCRCPRPGGTMENAVEINDDDDDGVGALARPRLAASGDSADSGSVCDPGTEKEGRADDEANS